MGALRGGRGFKARGESKVEGGEWLVSDARNMCLLGAVDRTGAIREASRSTFAPGMVMSML